MIGADAAHLVWAYDGSLIINEDSFINYVTTLHPSLADSKALEHFRLCLGRYGVSCRALSSNDCSTLLLWDASLSEEKARATAQSFDDDVVPMSLSLQAADA